MHLQPKDFVATAAAMQRAWSREESLEYTRWLATSHYENFHVVSFLLPRHLHRDFYNVYSFCRWADDLGDEIGDAAESLRLLAWWRVELQRMYAGEATHPVFVALLDTVRTRELPMKPFDDLICAFEHDQRVTRYANWDEVTAYCTCSANPVGRLLLALCGYRDPQRFELSDFTCTGLQLANFWQDVTVDLGKDRIYMPQDAMARHGVTDADVFARRSTPEFAALMRELVEYTRALFEKGLPLADMVNRRLAVDITLFSRGGMRVLDKIAAQEFDVLRQRPSIAKSERVRILLGTLLSVGLRRAA